MHGCRAVVQRRGRLLESADLRSAGLGTGRIPPLRRKRLRGTRVARRCLGAGHPTPGHRRGQLERRDLDDLRAERVASSEWRVRNLPLFTRNSPLRIRNSSLATRNSSESQVNYAPLVYRTSYLDTTLWVQNLSAVVNAKVKVYFLDHSGDVITSIVDWICPRGSQSFFLPVIHNLPEP